ncbi:MAG: T9SS type A sorting domain-containing protein [Bacteroidales bacterium]
MTRFLLSLLILIPLLLQSQDTLRLMHYNLLMYGNDFGGCNASNNNVNDKNNYLRIILDYVKPDILTVNEIYKDAYFHDLILNSVLNINGVDHFQRGYPINTSNSFIINQVYYNSQKFEMVNYVAVQTSLRDIDVWRFAYKPSSGFLQAGFVELNCAVAHLKAGSSSSDQQQRANETSKLMNYLNNSNANGNYSLSGDLNLYSGTEPAFQNLLYHSNPQIRFYDPINQIGSWHDNPYYAQVHTQSTHTSGTCPSGGGMDDRFDFILVSEEILTGQEHIKYVEGSYRALGQDGQRLNASLTDPPQNTSVPGNVLNALYNLSDHLPVVMDIVIGDNLGSVSSISSFYDISFQNPVKDQLVISVRLPGNDNLRIDIFNMIGQPMVSVSHPVETVSEIQVPVEDLAPGIYFIRLQTSDYQFLTKKLIRN